MRSVCIIPARGGSRRIPRKNIRYFHGEPIIGYSIEAALESLLFDDVYVSTEDEIIAGIADYYGAGIINRPPQLAEIGSPDYGTHAVTAHAVSNIEGDIDLVCELYATAPMITPEDLRLGRDRIQNKSIWAIAEVDGWFYWGSPHAFKLAKPELYDVKLPHPERVIDINTEADWTRAERMYEELHRGD